ncbi:hypothetical protein K439DRAFT_1613378 [Ramaria rubella]|nr:hypothetical protein K439DRAFT_1613378 [Ramaria rubella]
METTHVPRAETLLSAIHSLTTIDAFPSSSAQELHPFAESHDTSNAVLPQLKNILSAASLISIALSTHSALPVSDSKLVSLMRQHASLAHELNTTEIKLASRIKNLRERRGVDYGEDMPSSKASLTEWFLARMECWGNSAGMQIFNEPETDGKLGIVLAGKILVLDIEFHVQKIDDKEMIKLISLKSSHASPLDAPATSASSLPTSGASLDTFLAATLREYLEHVQEDQANINPIHIAKLGRSLKAHMQYIMKLDNLAQREVEGGSRWFTEVDDLGSVANQVVPKEAETVAKGLATSHAPLDILLLRGHALPLPYLRTPSLSFLVYLSPLAYLTLLRSSHQVESSSINIPMTILRSYLSKDLSPKGSVVANLALGPSSQPSHFAEAHGRPTFPLLPPDSLEDTDFQSLDHILPVDNGPDAWVLDFGPEGVVLSQSRMWEIQLLLGLAPGVDTMQMMSFGYSGSWVDLLVQRPYQMPYERYTATYASPTNAHPPLHLRLTAPHEPGFILRKIRVQSMRDIWSICEIVKEQSWYNHLFDGCYWVPEGLSLGPDIHSDEINQDSIDMLLSGSTAPTRIPVNMAFESPLLPPLFETQLHRVHPSLAMVFPSKTPGAPLINASIAFDSSTSACVRVIVNGIAVPGFLEESIRRGGAMGLAGRLWTKSGQSSVGTAQYLSQN